MHKWQQRRDDKPWQSQNGTNPGKERRINSAGGKGAVEDVKAKEGMLINKKRLEKEKTMHTRLFADKTERETIRLWNKSKQGRWVEQEIEIQSWRRIYDLERNIKKKKQFLFEVFRYKLQVQASKM